MDINKEIKKGGPGSGKKKGALSSMVHIHHKDDKSKIIQRMPSEDFMKLGLGPKNVGFLQDHIDTYNKRAEKEGSEHRASHELERDGKKIFKSEGLDMNTLDKEIEEMSKSMEQTTEASPTLEDVILELGPEGLKKALPTLTETQKALLSEVLENMAKAKSEKEEENLEKKQGVPKGADPATHERCVKDVKAQGHDKSSAYAICNAAGAGMAKSEKEESQVDVPDQMKKEMSGQEVPADAAVPAPRSEDAKKKKVKVPMSGDSQELADEVKKADSLQPTVDTTENGGMKENLLKPSQDNTDEKAAEEAKRKQMQEQRHQGGVPVEGWEGQVIKSKKEEKEDSAKKKLAEAVDDIAESEAEESKKEHEKEMHKKEMKKSFKEVISRMIERKLEKSRCISALAKSADLEEAKVVQVWGLIEKSMSSDASLDASAKNPEEKQSDLPKHMKDEGKKEEMPMSGKSPSDADSGEKPMKKSDSFYYDEEPVYEGAPDVFKANRFGKNTHWDVDAYIEAEETATKANLAKSTFLYPGSEELKKSSGAPSINDLIEQSLDMDSCNFETALALKKAKEEGAFYVNSFSDEDMDSLFANDEAEEDSLGKSNDLNKGGPGSGRKGHKTARKPYENPNPKKKPSSPIVEGITATGKPITSEAKPAAAKPGPNDHKFDKEKYRSTPEYKDKLESEKKKAADGYVSRVTSSGKYIGHRANHPDHHDWSAQDHEDAMEYHRDAQGPLSAKLHDHYSGRNAIPPSEESSLKFEIEQHKKNAAQHAEMSDHLSSKMKKSFSDEDMEYLFTSQDMWGNKE